MRARTMADETLAEIKEKIADGTYKIKEAANAYNVPAPTLYRNLRERYGKIEVHLKMSEYDPIKRVREYIDKHGITPATMTSHQKMLLMDGIYGFFETKALCEVFGVATASFRKHRQNLAKGPNGHVRREKEIEATVETVLAAHRTMREMFDLPPLGSYVICRALRNIGIVTSPHLVRRILERKAI